MSPFISCKRFFSVSFLCLNWPTVWEPVVCCADCTDAPHIDCMQFWVILIKMDLTWNSSMHKMVNMVVSLLAGATVTGVFLWSLLQIKECTSKTTWPIPFILLICVGSLFIHFKQTDVNLLMSHFLWHFTRICDICLSTEAVSDWTWREWESQGSG